MQEAESGQDRLGGGRWELRLNLKSQISNLRSQISDLRSQISDLRSQISYLGEFRFRMERVGNMRETRQEPWGEEAEMQSGGGYNTERRRRLRRSRRMEKHRFAAE